jgi:rhodanese-related sulfurtransferase
MQELLQAVPGAKRALFRLYHIGGCSSCGFRMDETLAGVCARNGIEDAAEVLDKILEEAAREDALLVQPAELARELASQSPPLLVDIRSPQEFEAVHIGGSKHLSPDFLRELLSSAHRDSHVVLVDHTGDRALDGAAYLQGHGMANVRVLRGGIDAWCMEVDSSMPRYTLA